MVVAFHSEKIVAIEIPTIDLSMERSEVSKMIVKACEEYGFFKVTNHGVPEEIIARMEKESLNFFSKPLFEKQKVIPANPFGYGRKNIGFNGDIGEVEYLLFNTNPLSIFQSSKCISNNPSLFSSAAIGYIESVRELACELLDLMAEALWVPDTSVFSNLIRDIDSDSVFRLNYYPPFNNKDSSGSVKIGFGEHTDPQILTLLRSNDVGGLQISLSDDVWLPVPPDPTSFCVNVGDLLQAMTNGRFVSVKHRVVSYSNKSRMSMAYFAAPSLNSWIAPVPEIVRETCVYRPFTWTEYKSAAYSRRLGDSRLDLFQTNSEDESN